MSTIGMGTIEASLAERGLDLARDLLVRPVARPAELERGADRRQVGEDPDGDPGHIGRMDRLEPGRAVARDRDDARRDAHETRHDVEEPVARAELERRLEDRPVEAESRTSPSALALELA
jgi:hypothetical protein